MEFLRRGNLVYIAILKNASRFYLNFFKLQLGWENINIEDINWDDDTVFAHMSNPMDRHVKGIVQAAKPYVSIIRKLIDNDEFSEILGYSIVDVHSMPLCITLGHYAQKIDWIPLDEEIQSEYLTVKFLEYHNIIVEPPVEPQRFRNSNAVADKLLRNKIRQLIEKNKENTTLDFFYKQDILLYNKVKSQYMKFRDDVIKKYNVPIMDYENSKKVWKELNWKKDISWLRHE